MQWISECDTADATVLHQALVLAADDPIGPAYIELWKRILSDGCAQTASSGWQGLGIEICERQREVDKQGYMHVKFRDGQQKPCKGVGQYFLRGDTFTCLMVPGEDGMAERRRQLSFLLDQYTLLKQAAVSPEVRPLLDRINSIRPLAVRAAAGFGWFDLQIGADSFGPLPAEDQATLEGRTASPAEVMMELAGGSEWMAILRELTAALVAYTPAKFEVICCDITEGVEQGQRALFYNIQCPSLPGEGTTVANERVHAAATRMVQHLAPAQGTFPGVSLRLELQADGRWNNSVKLMPKAAA
jgi:hypothetical protein